MQSNWEQIREMVGTTGMHVVSAYDEEYDLGALDNLSQGHELLDEKWPIWEVR